MEALAKKKKALAIATNWENAADSATVDMLKVSIETEEKRIGDVSLEYEQALSVLNVCKMQKSGRSSSPI